MSLRAQRALAPFGRGSAHGGSNPELQRPGLRRRYAPRNDNEKNATLFLLGPFERPFAVFQPGQHAFLAQAIERHSDFAPILATDGRHQLREEERSGLERLT